MFKSWYIYTAIHVLSLSIFHNNIPAQAKSINEVLSQNVLTEMTCGLFQLGLVTFKQ